MRNSNELDLFEEKVKQKVSGLTDNSKITSKRREHKVSVNDGNTIDAVDQMSPKNKFKTPTFYSIIEELIAKIEKQKSIYLKLNQKFNFLTNPRLNDEEIRSQAIKLVEAYPSDLETDFVNEFLIF